MDLDRKDLPPECAAAARKLVATVIAQRTGSAVRHPAFAGWAGVVAGQADDLAAAVPPFPRASLNYLAKSLRAAAQAHSTRDHEQAAASFATALRFARSLLRTLDRYAPVSTPTLCGACGEPYVAALARIPRQIPSAHAESGPAHFVTSHGAAYEAEAHTPCAAL
ncbi:hypothetical protein [Yinghuangia seranimata]|uniref:hypothetical protein n=1 Tax=Yinghuangia seranimata TaxID=408067 RepID=UPI00248CFE4E|nr:hypothetical protein [Yinghuangia seranimata]MDI2132892.1 hypothetical protein [Yinghuangia seranimata]